MVTATTPELEEFLATGMKRQIDADFALHDGDPEPRSAMWSDHEPVSLFGASVAVETGPDAVREVGRWLAERMSESVRFDVDLIAAGVSGDLAYTVAFERSEYTYDGRHVPDAVLRVTQIYRREGGEWRLVHRHGDHPPVDGRKEA